MTPLLLSAGATAANAASTIAGGRAAQQSGLFAQRQKDFEASQQEQAAQQGRATAQRSAFEKQREGRLALSRLQARDPGNIDLAGNLAGRSALQALATLAGGENQARQRENEAMASRLKGVAARQEGEARRRAANLSALGTILGGQVRCTAVTTDRQPSRQRRPALYDPARSARTGRRLGLLVKVHASEVLSHKLQLATMHACSPRR